MIRQSTPKIDAVWQRFTEQPSWKTLLQSSFETPIFIYKHSSRCGVSHASWDEIKPLPLEYEGRVAFYYIDVIRERAASMSIAQQSGIRHESPQVLLLSEGEVKHNWTHWGIRFSVMEEALDQLVQSES
ncbi:MAG: bacillithiol system redox-active protein YtxJ [Bacteroidota bacterium]